MSKDMKKAGRPKQDVTLDKKQEIRCSEQDKALWLRATKKQGFNSVSAWARDVLNNAAKD